MLFSNLKSVAEKNRMHCSWICIGNPIYFTDLQRRVVLDAATIAGLHPLCLVHETIATTLAYGIYKSDLPENDQLNVAFMDVRNSSFQVCIVGFKKVNLRYWVTNLIGLWVVEILMKLYSSILQPSSRMNTRLLFSRMPELAFVLGLPLRN
ncbi:hypothetical protein Pint_11196 [Pistacia integerrima]|uniref:Uncharacterized protein n=1 Tax=Pistacia integerrima TaxID=434235 RepID=A0ACC0XHQ5_9ROSI|nr:hypothetical protein Pint_11196 [Pistacia integerrima]